MNNASNPKKVTLSEQIKNKEKSTHKTKELPFGIKATELGKYMVYGEILGTPAFKKNRKTY